MIQATFRAPDCAPCPDRPRCTRSSSARSLTFRPRTQYESHPMQHPRRAGHHRLAGPLCASFRVEGPSPKPRAAATSIRPATAACPNPPPARADRAGAQPRPNRRLAHRHPRRGSWSPSSPDSNQHRHPCEFASRVPTGATPVAYQLEGACREGIAARRHAPRRSPSRAALAVFQAALHLAEPCTAAT
jgi:hypothetical protein